LENLIIPEYGKAEIQIGYYNAEDLAILNVLSPNQKNIFYREGNQHLTIQNRAYVGGASRSLQLLAGSSPA
jgi:hypothetical protein